MFVEVVSGPLRAATITQGDLCSAKADAERLVIKKTEQFDRSIPDFLAGILDLPGIDPITASQVWPVIVTSHEVPHMELIIGRLAIISAEEPFFCEGAMQKGKSLPDLTRGWKSGPPAHFPFKNYLIEQGAGQRPLRSTLRGSELGERTPLAWPHPEQAACCGDFRCYRCSARRLPSRQRRSHDAELPRLRAQSVHG
jgi:hypothetical protein